MKAERFVPVSKQDKLEDGTWIVYYKGLYDSRDIMSDCVRPSWELSGEYEVNVMKPGEWNSTSYSFSIMTDKKAGNYISHLIHQGHFKTFESFINYLECFCKTLGTYSEGNGAKHGTITYELWKQYSEKTTGGGKNEKARQPQNV